VSRSIFRCTTRTESCWHN